MTALGRGRLDRLPIDPMEPEFSRVPHPDPPGSALPAGRSWYRDVGLLPDIVSRPRAGMTAAVSDGDWRLPYALIAVATAAVGVIGGVQFSDTQQVSGAGHIAGLAAATATAVVAGMTLFAVVLRVGCRLLVHAQLPLVRYVRLVGYASVPFLVQLVVTAVLAGNS